MIRSHLSDLLGARGLSLRQFARDIDYRFETVRRLANNDLERLPRDLLERACRELDIDLSDLLTFEPK